jgi:hypothetical protein
VPFLRNCQAYLTQGSSTFARPLAALVLHPLLCDVLDIGGLCELYISDGELQRLAHLHSPSLIVTNDHVQFWIVGRAIELLLGSPGRQHVAEVSCCGQIPHGIGVRMGG